MIESSLPAPTLRARAHRLIEVSGPEDRLGRALDLGLSTLVLLNVAAVVLESVESIRLAYAPAFVAFEAVSVTVFTVEYALRLWVCVEEPRFGGAGGRLRYALTPMAILDFLAFAPFWLGFGVDLRELRVIRVLRLLRLAKLARYSEALRTLFRVAAARREMLVTSLVLVLLLHLVASSALYFAEKTVQPDKFGSIPDAMWWSIATLTTVGYGDVFPITPLGKLLAAIVAVLGVGLFALPAGILGAGFVDELQRKGRAPEHCPHCGGQL